MNTLISKTKQKALKQAAKTMAPTFTLKPFSEEEKRLILDNMESALGLRPSPIWSEATQLIRETLLNEMESRLGPNQHIQLRIRFEVESNKIALNITSCVYIRNKKHSSADDVSTARDEIPKNFQQQHQVTQHQVTQHQVTQHQVTQHQVTQHQVTQHQVAQFVYQYPGQPPVYMYNGSLYFAYQYPGQPPVLVHVPWHQPQAVYQQFPGY
jgi:hypothetical protein